MGLLDRLRLRFRPPRTLDPDFGELTFMFIPNAPERSYWEAEWLFQPTGTTISIGIDGDESGPSSAARTFYLALPSRFERTIESVRPELDRVFMRSFSRPLAPGIWQDVKLAGFGLVRLDTEPVEWEVLFETTGQKWLGITIPMRGDRALEAVVET